MRGSTLRQSCSTWSRTSRAPNGIRIVMFCPSSQSKSSAEMSGLSIERRKSRRTASELSPNSPWTKLDAPAKSMIAPTCAASACVSQGTSAHTLGWSTSTSDETRSVPYRST